MTTIYIENKPYEVDGGKNLLEAILSLGIDLPYFCWHPAMGSVGACRQCAVKQFKDETDAKGRIVMACMTQPTEGMRISVDDNEAADFRKSIVEWLMTNHPHDCPVCDEGGECHLQDMTVMTGQNYRRFRFPKRTYNNQYLGPFLDHEMNRCIQCYRCVRFYRDYAGGRDFDTFGVHNVVYFGRQTDGVLENEFSGNLAEICPTGVFTDKTLGRHYARKWDQQTAPSVCVHCGLGCNTIPAERYGTLRRIRTRFNGDVNGYFLCDRGRFGYEFVNSPNRLRECFSKRASESAPAKKAVLEEIAALLRSPGEVIGIGSPRASLEANFALRALVGADNFYRGVSPREDALTAAVLDAMQNGTVATPTYRDIQAADAMLVLGEDLTNTAPIMALAIRQWLRQHRTPLEDKLKIPQWNDAVVGELVRHDPSPLYIAAAFPTKLDDVAERKITASPDELAAFARAVATALSRNAVDASDTWKQAALDIAEALRNAKRPVIVAGSSYGNEALIRAAAAIAETLAANGADARAAYVTPECNSLGLHMIGGKPIDALPEGQIAAAIVLENDLYRRVDEGVANRLLAKCKNVIVIDHMNHRTAAGANIGLPCGTFAESDGTLVSLEGRAQRFFQVYVPDGGIQESWRWLRDIMAASQCGEGADWETLDDVIAAMAAALPALAPVADAAPGADFRMEGMKMPREPHRYSGRTAMNANKNVSEPKLPDDPDAPLAFSMEGYQGQPPAPLLNVLWAPRWNSVQALNKFQQEVGGPLRGGDAGVRLVLPKAGGAATTAGEFTPTKPQPGQCLFVPVHHIFGSEELSAESESVATLVPKPYVLLGENDAAALGVRSGQQVAINIGGRALQLPARVAKDVAQGVAGLPAGLPDMPVIDLPAHGTIAAEGAP